MKLRQPDYEGIPGITESAVPGSVECKTVEAVVELCKRTGLFIAAKHEGIHSEISVGGTEIKCCLPMVIPSTELNEHWERTGTITRPSPLWVNQNLLQDINVQIKDDTSAIRRVSSWPIDR